MRILFLFLYLSFCSVFAVAQSGKNTLYLTQNTPQPIALHHKLAILSDAKGSLTAADVSDEKHADKWIIQPNDVIQFGYSDAYNWVRLTIKNADTVATDWIWELDIPATQRVDMYQITDGVCVKSIQTGTDFPFAKRWLAHRLFLFPIALKPQESSTLYVRVHNDLGSLSFFSHLYSKDNWHTVDANNMAVWVFFYTLFLLSLLVAIALLISLKEQLYAYYCGYIVCIILLLGNNSGFTYAYLWSNTPQMVFYIKLYSLLGLVVFMLNFQYHLLYTVASKRPIIGYGIRVLSGALLICVFLVSIGIPISVMQRIIPIGHTINVCGIIWIAGLLLYSIVLRYRPAYYFSIAVVPILIVGLLMILRNYQFIHAEFLSSPFVMPTAFLIEIIALFFTLLQHIFALRKVEQAKIKAEQALHYDRIRISRDLHDNVGAHLTQIITGLDFLEQKNAANKPALANLKLLSQKSIAQLRETIWTLHNDTINAADFSDKLIAYTRRQVAIMPKLTLRIVRDAPEDLETFNLAPLQALNLYRIVQEAINNALKYAQATHLSLHFDYQKPYFTIIIKDNGIGFDTKDDARADAYGLQNMRARATEINATFELQSAKNEGTTVTIRL
jgi:two-component system, sensor histidine kinase LadS